MLLDAHMFNQVGHLLYLFPIKTILKQQWYYLENHLRSFYSCPIELEPAAEFTYACFSDVSFYDHRD